MYAEHLNNKLAASAKDKMKLEHFSLMKIIGQGSYAKVALVRKKDNGNLYALKILKKINNSTKKFPELIKTERNILVSSEHPFIVKLFYAFQNSKRLFLALEYCPGGDLFNLLTKKKVLSENQTRFYAAQILLAIAYLHRNKIIYRDLKPENVLLDSEGFIRLTDFGLSKQESHYTNSICGTPEYIAPEILLKQSYNQSIDWWMLGCLIYEMITGLPPFYSPSTEEMFQKILYSDLKIPENLSYDLTDLLKKLLEKDPTKRLGSDLGGANQIFNHQWFAGINWQSVFNKEVIPPFLPVLKENTLLNNLEVEYNQTPDFLVKDSLSSKSASSPKNTFENFTWDRFSDEQRYLS